MHDARCHCIEFAKSTKVEASTSNFYQTNFHWKEEDPVVYSTKAKMTTFWQRSALTQHFLYSHATGTKKDCFMV